MSEYQTQVIHQEVPRDYRTEIPNIVFVMLEEGMISNSDFLLYCTYRKIAGENGGCWYGTRALTKKSGLSHPTIAKSKKILSSNFEILEGKSLIKITPCDRQKEVADVITIVDIWPENYKFFKKRLTCEKKRHTGVKKDDTEERTNKERTNYYCASSSTKQAPAGGNNNFYKCLDKCDDLSDRQKRMLMKHPEELVKQAVRYAYHPTTQIQGGPIGRIKLLQYFLKHPEEFTQTMENLDKPPQKLSKKDMLIGRFKRGETYNGYEFIQDDIGVGFYQSGMLQPYSVRWDSHNFAHEFLKLLKKCGIEP